MPTRTTKATKTHPKSLSTRVLPHKTGLYRVPPALWSEIKIRAMRRGVTTSSYVVSVLAREVGFDLEATA